MKWPMPAVHIVLPRRSLFVQESQPATASVLLQLKPGAQLTRNQVRAISNLVASSVEGLTPDNVTIVGLQRYGAQLA
jgi:flagellar M-ring protein FliF